MSSFNCWDRSKKRSSRRKAAIAVIWSPATNPISRPTVPSWNRCPNIRGTFRPSQDQCRNSANVSPSWNNSSSNSWTSRPTPSASVLNEDLMRCASWPCPAWRSVSSTTSTDSSRIWKVSNNRSARARLLQSTGTTRSTIALLALGAILQLVLLGSVYYLIHHDITNRRRVAAELRRQGELLQAANKELEAFSYSVSHDLRAPLRHIDGYAALLSKTAGQSLNDKAQRYLQTISESAKQMGQLIDDLLVFSRMGRQEMLRSTVNLNQLVKTVIHDLRLDLQGRTISWTIGSLPDVPGDPAMLRQVFMNLISNAVKFTATRPKPHIEIGATRQLPGEVTLFVRDNGVGFDMQYVNKLFGVFQRLHRNDEFEGTGIGLANVRRIVHRHGGRTWAEGKIDHGATFYVSLPMKRSAS